MVQLFGDMGNSLVIVSLCNLNPFSMFDLITDFKIKNYLNLLGWYDLFE